MADETENTDNLDPGVDLEVDEVGPIPHSWISVFGGVSAFGFVATAAILSILQFVASRPFDMLSISDQTARSIEIFLTNHNVSPEQIMVSEPTLIEESRAHYYSYEYAVQLSKNVKAESLERLMTQKMTRNDLIVADLIEGGVKQGVSISFGEFVFAKVRFITPTERQDYAVLSPAPTTTDEIDVSEASLPAVSLPRVNKAVLPTSSTPNTSELSTRKNPETSPKTPEKKAYTGWAPANRRASIPQPSTNAADDIELARIPSSDVPEPLIETPMTAPTPPITGKLAIIVDDGGYGGQLTETILGLNPNLTLSILPNTPLGTKLAQVAHEKGFEIMLHMPMENTDPELKHPGQLNIAMSEEEIARWTDDALQQIPHAVGVNNHTGSKFTADAKAMALFMEMIKDRDLYFIDSKTTPDTRAFGISKAFQVPSAMRDLFLDHDNATKEIRRRFRQVVRMAKENGQAIAICHFRPNTAAVLGELLLTLESEGVALVHASELIQ